MRITIFTTIIFLFTSVNVFGQFDHQAVLSNLTGDELFEKLVEDFKPQQVLSFADSRDTLFAIIHAENNVLECVYTGHMVTLDPDIDPTISAFEDGDPNGINTEHTYPRSMGADKGNGKSDMHHLYPTRAGVNSARGNDPFDEINDSETQRWYYLSETQTNIPSEDIDLYSEDKKGGFEPKEDHKGDVARAMFYFYTMYRPESDAANPTYFADQADVLCEWHWQDPVDQKEWVRNQKIAPYQDNKTNPFILDCSLAARLYCPNIDDACALVDIEEIKFSSPKIFPNPSNSSYHIDWQDQQYQITLANELGQIMMSEEGRDKTIIDVPSLPGIYYLTVVNGFAKRYTIKLVKL